MKLIRMNLGMKLNLKINLYNMYIPYKADLGLLQHPRWSTL